MTTADYTRPTKKEQLAAMASYDALEAMLNELETETPEIEIEETQEKIKVPLNALKLLSQILKETAKGNPVAIVPQAAELTTTAAAEILGCSRPHIIKLLETKKIPFTKVGRHRRIKFEDLAEYKKQMKEEQRALLIELMKGDEEAGLYDS